MDKDKQKQIDEVLKFLIYEKDLTIDERAQAILNFAKKLEAEKKIILNPKKNVIQGLKK